jgi:hypothetical protein
MNRATACATSIRLYALLLWLIVSVAAAGAQKNEFAFLASTFQTSASFDVHGGQGLQLNYARRVVHIPLASLYLEIPFAAAWGGNRSVTQGNLLHEDYNTMYLTPGLKLKLLPSSFISPYLAGGLGWGGFRSTNTSATSNQFAGGADFTILPILSLRVRRGTITPVLPLSTSRLYFTAA